VAGFLYIVLIETLVLTGLISPSFLAWSGLAAGLVGALVVGKLLGLTVARLRLQRARPSPDFSIAGN
jgi:hypothetical protein